MFVHHMIWIKTSYHMKAVFGTQQTEYWVKISFAENFKSRSYKILSQKIYTKILLSEF